jgi:hypothetical protein
MAIKSRMIVIAYMQMAGAVTNTRFELFLSSINQGTAICMRVSFVQ